MGETKEFGDEIPSLTKEFNEILITYLFAYFKLLCSVEETPHRECSFF